MPKHVVKCPCGKTSVKYRSLSQPVPTYCNMECRRRFWTVGKPKKYHFTPEMDAEIRRVYQEAVYMPGAHKTAPVKRLAKRFGMPRPAVTKRAGELGVRMMTRKEGNWTEPELEILRRNAHHTPITIQRRLKKAGFARSEVGIVLKRKRMNFLSGLPFETVRSLAECLGVDDHAVTRHIHAGRLKAKRRGTRRTPQQGGDQWLIKDKDIRQFIIENVSILDFRKIDKFWLVDLLAGGEHGLGSLERAAAPEPEESIESIESPSFALRAMEGLREEVLELFGEAQRMAD